MELIGPDGWKVVKLGRGGYLVYRYGIPLRTSTRQSGFCVDLSEVAATGCPMLNLVEVPESWEAKPKLSRRERRRRRREYFGKHTDQ